MGKLKSHLWNDGKALCGRTNVTLTISGATCLSCLNFRKARTTTQYKARLRYRQGVRSGKLWKKAHGTQ